MCAQIFKKVKSYYFLDSNKTLVLQLSKGIFVTFKNIG